MSAGWIPIVFWFCFVLTTFAADTTNVYNSVVTNLTTYTVNGSSSANRQFDIWNSSQISVAGDQTVGSNSFGSLTLNGSTNFPSGTFTVGQIGGATGIVSLVGGACWKPPRVRPTPYWSWETAGSGG